MLDCGEKESGMTGADDKCNFDIRDVRIDTMRTGNMANRADSAVRVTHTPTGLSVYEDSSMGQHRNRKIALQKLSALLEGGAD